MPDLRIKPNVANGDLPEQKDLFTDEELLSPLAEIIDGQETKLEPITLGDCKIEFKDILNPTTLREWFEKVNGQENKDKEKA